MSIKHFKNIFFKLQNVNKYVKKIAKCHCSFLNSYSLLGEFVSPVGDSGMVANPGSWLTNDVMITDAVEEDEFYYNSKKRQRRQKVERDKETLVKEIKFSLREGEKVF